MMEKDTEVTKESFIPSILKTIEKDGKDKLKKDGCI